jgi:hypothetical protein
MTATALVEALKPLAAVRLVRDWYPDGDDRLDLSMAYPVSADDVRRARAALAAYEAESHTVPSDCDGAQTDVTSELVKRLKARTITHGLNSSWPSESIPDALCHQGADTIARLTAEIEGLKSTLASVAGQLRGSDTKLNPVTWREINAALARSQREGEKGCPQDRTTSGDFLNEPDF